jgi:adenosine deaminase
LSRSPGLSAFFRGFRTRPKGELHLHLEGAISPSTLVRLSRRLGEPAFPTVESVRARCLSLSAERFFALYRDVCRHLTRPSDYTLLARDLVRHLVREGISHAEVYVSPAIVERIGLSWPAVVAAIEPVFAAHEAAGRGAVRVLLDSVRHWGPDAAMRVLDLHEQTRWARVVGFGLGGDEASVPARAFEAVYERVRELGLAPLVHAGEWAGPESVAEALERLRPVRIAHGVRAAEDPRLVALLARKAIPLDVCIASNLATGVVTKGEPHPALALLRAGVVVTLSTDDPGLFGTTLRNEYAALARLGATADELDRVVGASLSASLGPSDGDDTFLDSRQ